jgi:hypothetical protein
LAYSYMAYAYLVLGIPAYQAYQAKSTLGNI